jgi:biotin/methionine sulfoxide reductase
MQTFMQVAHWGAFQAVVEAGRFVRAEPFARDPAPSKLLDAMPEMVYSTRRVARPAVRREWLQSRSRKRSGHNNVFVEVSWDAALKLVAEELQRVREERGPQGIFGGSYGWSSAGRFHHARTQLRRFLFAGGGCTDQIGNYSWGAAQTFLPHVIGTFEPVAGRATSWHSIVRDCDVLVAFGGLALRNAQVTAGGVGEHTLEAWLRQAKARGVEFINISPNRDDMPGFLEAQWIAPHPGTDTALMLGIAHELVRRGQHDLQFLQSHCVGFDAFAAYLMGQSDGTAKSPAWAAAICGVTEAQIVALADRLAGRRSMLTFTWSLQRAHRGEQPYWMGITLAAMLGSIGLPGGGFAFGHGSMNGAGVPRVDVPAPEMAAGVNAAAAHNIPVARVADMLMRPGAEYQFNGQTRRYPDIDLVYWCGGNPYHHHQDLNRFMRAWEKPQTVIVHESHWTACAQRADIVLPATTTLERSDISGTSRDRFVFAMMQAINPVGSARNDHDIFCELSDRLGFADKFTEGRSTEQWVAQLYARYTDAAAAKGVTLPAFDTWRDAGYCELPEPEQDFLLFGSFRRDPQAHPLKTPSGRIELVSSSIGAMQLPDMPPHATWAWPDENAGHVSNAEPTRYPLHLLTHQPSAKLHSQGDFAAVAQSVKAAGREIVSFNPADAHARNLEEGQPVGLFNDRGEIEAVVHITDAVRPGVAMMQVGAWFAPDARGVDSAGNPNVLSADRGTSSLTQGCAALSLMVEARALR